MKKVDLIGILVFLDLFLLSVLGAFYLQEKWLGIKLISRLIQILKKKTKSLIKKFHFQYKLILN